MALPGVGVGVGRSWTVRGEVVEVTTRARWDLGRVGGGCHGGVAEMGLKFREVEGWLEIRSERRASF